MLIQTEPQLLEEIHQSIKTEGEKIIVFTEGRKPRCFNVDLRKKKDRRRKENKLPKKRKTAKKREE